MGAGSLVTRGSVVVVELPPTRTHEQAGRRPCIVVSNEQSVANARYEMVVVVPLTSTRLNGKLYPFITKGDASLKKDSVALIDQIRSIDKCRVQQVGRRVSQGVLDNIDDAIKYLFGYAL